MSITTTRGVALAALGGRVEVRGGLAVYHDGGPAGRAELRTGPFGSLELGVERVGVERVGVERVGVERVGVERVGVKGERVGVERGIETGCGVGTTAAVLHVVGEHHMVGLRLDSP